MAGSEEQEARVEQLAKDAEQEARSLQKDAEELGERIDETRGDWMRKHRDETASDAPPADEDESEGEGGEAADEVAG